MGEELYKMLVDDGLYTKGYDDFIQKYGSEHGQEKLWKQMSNDGLYTKSIEDFKTKYFQEVKKKDGTQASTIESSEPAGVAEKSFEPVTSDVDSPPLIDQVLEQPPIAGVPSDVSGSVGEYIDPNFDAYDKLSKKRNGNFETNAYDLNKDKIETIAKVPKTLLEEKLSEIPTPSEELTGKENPFKPKDQASFREYQTMTNELVSENREINKSLEFLARQIRDSFEEDKKQGYFEEYDRLSKLYDKNIQKYKDEISSGRYMDAVDFQEYLQEVQRQKDEKYQNATIAGKLARNTGTILFHSIAKAAQGVASLTDVVEKSVGLEGEDRGIGDKLQDLYIGLGDDIQNAFPAPSSMQRGGFTETADWNGYEVDFRDGEIASVRKDGYLVDIELTKEQKEEIKGLNKETRFHSGSFAYQAGSVIADAGVQILGAKGIGSIGIAGRTLGTKFGLAAATAGMMANGLYQEGIENGLSEENAARYALGTSSLIGVSSVLVGAGAEERFLGVGLKVPSPKFGKGIGGAIGEKSFNVVKGGLGEVFEEVGLEKWIDAGMQHVMNKTAGGEFEVDPYSDGTEVLNEAALSFVAGGLFDMIKTGKKTPIGQSMLMDGSKNIDETIEATKELAEKNNDPLTENEEQQLRNDLKNVQEAIDRTPDEVSTSPEVVEMVADKNKAENEAKEVKKKIKDTDSSFTAPLEQKVKRLEEKAEGLKSEIAKKAKEVKSEPQYEPVSEENLEKGRVYFNEELGREYKYKGKDEEGNHVFEKVLKEGEVEFYQDQIALPGSNLVKGMRVDAKENILPGRKKKTVLTKRVYESEATDERLRQHLEEEGLYRESYSFEQRSQQAENLIDQFGEAEMERAVRNFDIRGGLATATVTKLIKRVDDQIWETSLDDTAKLDELSKEKAKLVSLLESESYFGAEAIGQLSYSYKADDIGYAYLDKKTEYEKSYGPIPQDVDAKFKDIDTKLRQLRKDIEDAEKRQEEQAAQQAVTDIKESIEREKASGKKTDIKEKAKRIADNIRKGKITRPDVFSMASPASLVWDGALEVVASSIEAGATVADAVKKGIEHIKGSDWYQGLTRAKQRDAENAFGDSFKEDTTSGLKIPKQLIRDLVEGGIDDINELVDAVREAEGLNGYSDRQIRDAITEYGKTVNLNRSELTDKISKLKNLGRLLSQLEDIEQGKRPKRSGLQRRRPEPEERALQRQVRELMKELPMDAETLATEQRTALDAKKKRVSNQIEDLEREIDKRETTKRSTKQVEPDQELKDLIEERDAKKKEWDEIFRDEKFLEQRRLEQAKKRTQKSIEDLERRLKEKDFSKKEIKPITADQELIKLKAEKLRLKEQYDKEFYKKQLEERSNFEVTRDALWDLWGLTRALMATGEFSFVGIQGLVQSIAHPESALKAFKNSIKFLFSQKKIDNWLREIKSKDFYADLKNSKLALTEPHAELKAREELFYSEWANLPWDLIGTPILWTKGSDAWIKWRKANPLKAVLSAIERAAVGYLDTLRVERFLQVRQKMLNEGKTFQDSPQDYKDVADAINTLTGRAKLEFFGGNMEQFAPALTKLFFSPRNWASQLKTATPYAFYYFGRLTPTARKAALADFGKAVGFTTSMVMLAAAYLNNDDDDETGVEFDPRSSDFMKIKLGRKRVDPWGGRIQQVVLTSRFLMDVMYDLGYGEGGYKNLKGEVMPLGKRFKSPTKKDVLLQAAINKLAPSASLMEKYFSTLEGKDGARVTKFGEPYELTDEVLKSLVPIYAQTISDLIKEDGGYDSLDGFLTFAAFFGTGVSVYEEKEKIKKKAGF